MTDKQLKAAAGIDARVRQLRQRGYDDLTIFTRMASDDMAPFKWLLDHTTKDELDGLCARFDGFYRSSEKE